MYASEIWVIRMKEEHGLERNKHEMRRSRCGVMLRDKVLIVELRKLATTVGMSWKFLVW